MKKLLLVDGSSLAYRGYYALIKNPLRNSRGFNTSGIYLFLNSLLKSLRDTKPTHGAVVFDSKKPTFRHKVFEAYKAERPRMPDDLSAQLPYIQRLAEALGLAVMVKDGYEADDVLYTLAKRAAEQGWDVIILTSDKDLLQLVNERISVLDTRPQFERLYTPEEVKEKFGVPPERVPDYLALVGDSIDGVPGVKGIGEKGAGELLSRYGSLEGIYQHLDEIKGKYAKALADGREDAKMSLELVRLVDVPGLPEPEELEIKEPDRSVLFPIFREMEFHTLIREFSSPYSEVYAIALSEAKPQGNFALSGDSEIFWGIEPGRIFHCPVEEAKQALSSETEKYAFHSKEVHKACFERGIELKGLVFDLVVADYLLDPSAQSETGKYKEGIEHLAPRYLGLMPSSNPRERRAEEVDLVLRVKDGVMERLKNEGLWELFSEIELPLARVLARMERAGIKVDTDYLRDFDRELEASINALLEEIYETAGLRFNLNSPKQLSHVLFEILKLKPTKKTKTGLSTDQSVLEALAKEHPLPGKILEYRELFKLRSTYTQALLDLVNPKTGRVHPTFHQTGTATGRVSCSDPNLQNIPIRTDIGKKIRRAFVAEEGCLLLDADYSQIELRIIAHITGDPGLCRAFKEGIDIHAATASAVLGKPLEAITQEDRRVAKMINFGIAYGMSPYGLAARLGIPDDQAKGIIEAYFASFPKVREWMDALVAEAESRGYVTTLLGRRRYVPGIRSENRQERESARRAAINGPFQGSAADIIKKAMVEIDEAGIRAVPLLQIHDELLYEVAESDAEEVSERIKAIMEDTLPLSVPLVVETSLGKSWMEAGK
ncbi:MAG: DNA polymerase I [candidate division WOR-3 bacterium]